MNLFRQPQYDRRPAVQPRRPVDRNVLVALPGQRIADVVEELPETPRVTRHAIENHDVEIGTLIVGGPVELGREIGKAQHPDVDVNPRLVAM